MAALPDWRNTERGMTIVKCACGLVMRNKNWNDHWFTCSRGSSVPVTEQDIKDLEYYEQTSPYGQANRDKKF